MKGEILDYGLPRGFQPLAMTNSNIKSMQDYGLPRMLRILAMTEVEYYKEF